MSRLLTLTLLTAAAVVALAYPLVGVVLVPVLARVFIAHVDRCQAILE